ncbi:MAG: STAS domain-containing protein [Phycisphaeraceae bacterium]
MLAQNINVDQTGCLAVATVVTPLLSLGEGQEIVAELQERIRYSNASLFILDLAEVEFMDSGFIGMLVGFLQEVQAVRGRIVLAECQPNVAFLFKVTRLDSVFTICDTLEEAKDELGG